MNHLYRIVRNAHAACWQAVSEIAKGRGKSTTKAGVEPAAVNGAGMPRAAEPRLRGVVLAIAAALLGLSLPAFAGPEGGSVSAGISQSGNRAAQMVKRNLVFPAMLQINDGVALIGVDEALWIYGDQWESLASARLKK